MANDTDDLQPEPTVPETAEATSETASETKIEAAVEAEPQAQTENAVEEEPEAEETETEAEDGPELESEDTPEPEGKSEGEFTPKPRPPAKLERLQKILAAAGVASRRSAEGMIEQGRVQVNGKIVTELGTKADAGRDHIRVDGKLLQGPERLRYFILNKPKGFVTTVKDPEGRPTVMQFFDKMKERLYPVGRLDYQSEGLLVVTNDGDLANRLTKASSGVEKTYLVKVAGQPSEAELDILRSGVTIERGKPGSAQVRTSPARIRQVRQGDNPWYEVILIEGRNRELRKMFEEIGHFVEKIRRVGYGPLVLDQEPGNLRELEPEELDLLRKAAEGKLRTPKSKDLRRRNAADAGRLPTVLPKPSGRPHVTKSLDDKQFEEGPAATSQPGEFRPKKVFGAGASKTRPSRPAAEGFRPAAGRTSDRGPARTDDRPRRTGSSGPAKFGSARPSSRPSDRSDTRPSARPAWKKDDRPARPPSRFAADSTGESRRTPGSFVPDRPAFGRPPVGSKRPSAAGTGRTGAGRPFSAKPTWKRPEDRERPSFQRPAPPRREFRDLDEDLGPVRPPNLHIEEIQPSDRPSSTRSSAPRSSSSRPSTPRSYSDRTSADRPSSDRPRPSRSSSEGPASSDRPSSAKPFRSEGGLARPYTTSSGKPRAGGARPSSKPGRPAGRSYGSASGARSGSGPRGGSDSRPSYGAKRTYGANSAGPAKRSFSRDEGKGSFAPRSPRPAAGSGPSSSRSYTPRTEGTSDYRPTSAKPYPSSASRAERKAGPDWKSKPSFGKGKPASGARSKPKSGGFSRSGYKAKPGGSGAKRTGPRPGGKKRK